MGLGGDTSCPEEANRLRQVPGRHLGRLPAAANSLRSRLAMRRPGGLSSLSTSHRRQPRRQRETVLFETTLAGKHQGFPTPLPTHGKRGGIRETPGRGWNRLPTHTHTSLPPRPEARLQDRASRHSRPGSPPPPESSAGIGWRMRSSDWRQLIG